MSFCQVIYHTINKMYCHIKNIIYLCRTELKGRLLKSDSKHNIGGNTLNSFKSEELPTNFRAFSVIGLSPKYIQGGFWHGIAHKCKEFNTLIFCKSSVFSSALDVIIRSCLKLRLVSGYRNVVKHPGLFTGYLILKAKAHKMQDLLIPCNNALLN
jgi:hypothetical protein